ncbi:MAG TPA: insulinase family protein, partial [Aggregicoccus sp.]|nr:insulinase family protein [Aggregicoccus sp.]
MSTQRWLVAGALLLLATAATAQSSAPPAAAAARPPGADIQTRTLKNGLKVIVWPDHDIPNVALYNWFRVGSRNEAPGITGLSHFFEHMMFNGAKKYGPGEFDRVMEANGGAN